MSDQENKPLAEVQSREGTQRNDSSHGERRDAESVEVDKLHKGLYEIAADFSDRPSLSAVVLVTYGESDTLKIQSAIIGDDKLAVLAAGGWSEAFMGRIMSGDHGEV